MDDLDKVQSILKDINKAKCKMTPEQYEQLMVYVLGMHAKLSSKPGHGKFKPCKPGELEVGDKVRITSNPSPDDDTNMYWHSSDPTLDYDQFKGKITTITGIDGDGDCTLAINKNVFAPEWLEKVS